MKAINNNLLCYFSRLHEVFHYLGTPWLQCNRNRTCSSWPLQHHHHTHLGLFLSSDNAVCSSLLFAVLQFTASLPSLFRDLFLSAFTLDQISSDFFAPHRNALDFHSCKLLLNLIARRNKKKNTSPRATEINHDIFFFPAHARRLHAIKIPIMLQMNGTPKQQQRKIAHSNQFERKHQTTEGKKTYQIFINLHIIFIFVTDSARVRVSAS